MKLPRQCLALIEAHERRVLVEPLLHDEHVDGVDLALLAQVLVEEPAADDDGEAHFGRFLEVREFGVARHLLHMVPVDRRSELEGRLSDELFLAQCEVEGLLQECRERWAEGLSAHVIDPPQDGAPLETAEEWFRRRPTRLGPLRAFLLDLRSAIDERLDAERSALEQRLQDAAERARAQVQREELRASLEDFVRTAEHALREREWSVVRDGVEALESVAGDTTALRIARRPRDSEGWRRAIPTRPTTPAPIDLATLVERARDDGEDARKFLQSWRDQRTLGRGERAATRTHLGIQWAKWLGFAYDQGEARGDDEGLVFDFHLRAPVQWVPDRHGAKGAPYHLLIPNARRGGLLPSEIKQRLRQLAEQARGEGLRVFLYPGGCPVELRRSTASRPERTVIVDDVDLDRLVECPADERPRAFLEIILPQLPIDRTTPYSVQHGATPESMFVGRAAEMELLSGRHGAPTIVFSGRCLGKTSLLRQVARRFHDPARSRFAFFRSISTLGDLDIVDGLVPNLSLLNVIVDDLRGCGFAVPEVHSVDDFQRALRNLLRAHPVHEFLFLLDEADAFADSERRYGGKGVSWALRDLQFEHEERIRFTFAGYQYVHRVFRQKSLAFANWRDFQRLSLLTEEEARQLVRRPLEELGFHFASPTLIERIVHYSGRHPRLVQVFCDRLCRVVRQHQRIEPFTITSSDVEQVFNDDGANGFIEALRRTMNLNLDDDPRLQFIVYWLVEQAMRGVVSLERFTLQRIHEALLAESGDVLELDETGTRLLLDDLIALGVVAPEGNLYRLANRQHARLLFQASDFKARRQDAAVRLRVRTSRRRVFPLSDEALEVLAQADRSHVCVLGTKATGDEAAFNAVFSRVEATSSRPAVVRVDCESASSWSDLEGRVARAVGAPSGGGDLAEHLEHWQRAAPSEGRTVVLQGVEGALAQAAGGLVALLECLGRRRLSDGSLAVRVVMSGGPQLARSFQDELLLYDTAAVTLTRLEPSDIQTWGRTRRLELDDQLARQLRSVTCGRLPLLDDFRTWLDADGRAFRDEHVVSRTDVEGYEAAARAESRRQSLARRLLSGLTDEEEKVLRAALAFEFEDPWWDAAETTGLELFMEACPEVSEEHVRSAVSLLVSLDLLGPPPRAGIEGFTRVNGDPLATILGA